MHFQDQINHGRKNLSSRARFMRIKPTKYLIFGIAGSDRCKPITTTPMIGQLQAV